MTPVRTPDLGRLRLLALFRMGWAVAWVFAFRSKSTGAMVERMPGDVWFPVSAAKLFEVPPSLGYVDLLYVLVLTGAAGVFLGLATRASASLCFVASVLFMSVGYSWGKIGHDTQIYLLLLLVMCFSDWGRAWSVDSLIRRWRGRSLRAAPTPWPDWPWWACLFVIAFIYVNSGLHKVFKGHFLDGGFHQYLKYRLVLSSQDPTPPPAWATDAVAWAIARPELIQMFAWGALLFEAGFAVAFLGRRVALFMLASIWAFHGGIGVFSGVYFVSPMVVSALLFVPLLALELRDRRGWFARALPEVRAAEPDATSVPAWGRTLAWMLAFAVPLATLAPLVEWEGPTAARVWLAEAMGGGRVVFQANRYALFFVLGLVGASALALWMARDAVAGLLRARASSPSTDVLLFDRDCGFCQRWVEWAKGRGAGERVRFEPCQAARALREPVNITVVDCTRSAYFLGPREEAPALAGAAAINAVLRRLPGGRNAIWRGLGMLGGLHGVRHVEQVGYRLVARFRHRLGPGACRVADEV